MSELSSDYTHYSTESVLQLTHEKLAIAVVQHFPDFLKKNHELSLSTSVGSVALANRFRIVSCNIAGQLEDSDDSIIIATEMDLGCPVDAQQIARNGAFSVTMRGAGARYADTHTTRIWPDKGMSLESRSGQGSLDQVSIARMARFVDSICVELEKPSRNHLVLLADPTLP